MMGYKRTHPQSFMSVSTTYSLFFFDGTPSVDEPSMLLGATQVGYLFYLQASYNGTRRNTDSIRRPTFSGDALNRPFFSSALKAACSRQFCACCRGPFALLVLTRQLRLDCVRRSSSSSGVRTDHLPPYGCTAASGTPGAYLHILG